MGLRIAIAGAGGRMGAANIRAVLGHSETLLVAAFDRKGSPLIGKDAGTHAGLEPAGIFIGEDVSSALDGTDAVIDFTAPAASVALAKEAAKRGLVHIIGTTGCSQADDEAIAAAARSGAKIVKSGNMSLGVNLLAALVRRAAESLGPDFDIEILEMHHRNKVDAPSGTALLLGEAAAQGRNIALADKAIMSREGHTGPREEGAIGFATLRGGSVVGDHAVILAGPSERLVLSHVAEDRALFANGAVKAALWAKDKPKGLYSMADVLGL